MLDVNEVLELECWLFPLEEHPVKNVAASKSAAGNGANLVKGFGCVTVPRGYGVPGLQDGFANS